LLCALRPRSGRHGTRRSRVTAPDRAYGMEGEGGCACTSGRCVLSGLREVLTNRSSACCRPAQWIPGCWPVGERDSGPGWGRDAEGLGRQGGHPRLRSRYVRLVWSLRCACRYPRPGSAPGRSDPVQRSPRSRGCFERVSQPSERSRKPIKEAKTGSRKEINYDYSA
jgi:hypothetical protein